MALLSLSLLLALIPSTEPVPIEDAPSKVRKAVDRGAGLLVDMQESLDDDKAKVEDCNEWPYEGVYRVRGEIPIGYRIGGTSISGWALCEVPGWEKRTERVEAVERATRFVLEQLDHPLMEPKSLSAYDVRGWGHAYALRLFARALDAELLDEDQTAKVRGLIPHLLHCLDINQTSRGGWNYAGDTPSPFMTGSTLLTLYEVRERGYEVEESMLEAALDALEAGRVESGAYAYSGRGREPMAASAARSSVAELALWHAGRSDEERLRTSVRGFFDNWEHLLDRKSKQGTHEGAYSIAPYYFFFGHTYTALAIESLPEDERPAWRARMAEHLWRTREENGGWNDRIFPRSEGYGTAMVVLALMAPSLVERSEP